MSQIQLTGTTISSQGGPGSNCIKGIPHILQSSKTGASQLDSLVSYPGHSRRGVLPLCRIRSVYLIALAEKAEDLVEYFGLLEVY